MLIPTPWSAYLLDLMVSTDQADPSCFYFRISWILMERRWFYFFLLLHLVQGLRSLQHWLLQKLSLETTWISLISWHYKTSNILCPLDLCGHLVVCDSFQLRSKHHFINQFEDLFIGLDIRNRFFRLAASRAAPWIDWMPTVKESTFRKQEIVL